MTKWLEIAKKYFGTSEVKGAKHNPLILKWWASIRAPFTDDETPWCAAFVGGVLEEAGLRSTRSAAARSYEKWGRETYACLGAIAVLWRGSYDSGKGHVGFVVGRDSYGNVMILGGNQDNRVSIMPFPQKRILSYRLPLDADVRDSSLKLGFLNLPLLSSDGIVSINEA